MRKNLVFYGHHKCGSRYFRTHILKGISKIAGVPFYQYAIEKPIYAFDQPDLLDLDNVDFERLASERCIIGLTNASSPVVSRVFANDHSHVGLHVRRDPRQFLVSSYFHHRDGHPTKTDSWYWPKLEKDRAQLESLDLEDGLIFEMDNISGDILDRQFRAWSPRSNIIEIKLEEVDEQMPELMSLLGERLQLDLRSITANPNLRQANANAPTWQQVFTPRVVQEFKSRFNDILIGWRYESDGAWEGDESQLVAYSSSR